MWFVNRYQGMTLSYERCKPHVMPEHIFVAIDECIGGYPLRLSNEMWGASPLFGSPSSGNVKGNGDLGDWERSIDEQEQTFI